MRYLILAAILSAGAAQAQTTISDVRDMLYPGAKPEVEILPNDFLPDDQAQLLKTVGISQPYYGAIAISPDEGIMVEATVAAANYHSTDAASAAALRGCNAARKGARECAVVALIRPRGWSQQPVQLSSGATDGFIENFKGASGKAFAVSPSTGDWGFARGANAAADAVADCGADCRVLLRD